nr:MAG TPA: hypothetical protein [Caudoviricetes sp.]
MIRKTHRQGRVILQPCKFFKVFDYNMRIEAYLSFGRRFRKRILLSFSKNG